MKPVDYFYDRQLIRTLTVDNVILSCESISYTQYRSLKFTSSLDKELIIANIIDAG